MRVFTNSVPCSRAIPVVLLPLCVGGTALIGQIVLLRELMVLFNGDELSLGIALAAWLAWTAAGAHFAGGILRHIRRAGLAFAGAELVCGASLPLTVWILHICRTILSPVTGELLGPVPMFFTTSICLSAFCGLSGCLFAIAAHIYATHREVPAQRALGVAYMLETLGSALGGILASFVLVPFLGSFQMATLVLATNASIAVIVLLRAGSKTSIVVFLCAAVAVKPLLLFVAPSAERSAEQRRWPGLSVVETRDSIYGRLTLTDAGGLKTIYDNGSVVANLPDPAAAEESIHFALLEHPAPRRVLILGGAAQGALSEALKHSTIEQIDYVEFDPQLASMLQRIPSADLRRGLSDPRVHLHLGDGRQFLSASTKTSDVIVVNVPEPETAQWNRFYTSEFFRTARHHLAPGGVIAIRLRSSQEFISPQRAEFLRCIHRTLAGQFPEIAIIPGDPLHMIGASRSGILAKDADELIARMQSRQLRLLYLSAYTLPFRMSPERLAQVEQVLQPNAHTLINHDFHPVAYYFNAVQWTAQFGSVYGSFLQRVAHVPFAAVMATACIVLVSLLALRVRKGQAGLGSAAARWSVLSGGYILMTLQLLLLLGFQCLYGYVYAKLAVLMGMFMAGMAVGAWSALSRAASDDGTSVIRMAAINQFAAAASAPLLMLVLSALARAPEVPKGDHLSAVVFPVLAFACGVPGGMQFPLAAEIYFAGSGKKANLGLLYALDLTGGCAGAILLGGFLVPVFGFWRSAWLSAAVGLPVVVLLVRASPLHRSSRPPSNALRIPVP